MADEQKLTRSSEGGKDPAGRGSDRSAEPGGETQFPPEQVRVLQALDPQQAERIAELAARLEMDQAQVAAAAVMLAQAGLCTVREEPYREWVLKDGGRDALAHGLVERRVLRALLAHDGAGALSALPEWSGLTAKDIGQSIKGLAARGWAVKDGAGLRVTEGGRRAEGTLQPDEAVLQALSGSGRLVESELAASGIDLARARDLLGARSPLVEIRDKVHRFVEATPQGAALARAGVRARRAVSLLTPELLASGQWREVDFKPYDVTLATEPRHPGKRHPLQRAIDAIRAAFLQMGFEESVSPWVESAFWDFDALFQPQDHPAREMADTFYVEHPARTPLPADRAMVDRVRAAHENGGDTGSLGWQYRWRAEAAERNILRTHNTATSIRAIAANPKGPRKVFTVGRVFRREAIDATHLPVFMQVDGIVIDRGATLASLFGTLTAFLQRLGFERVDFRPDFFPYTEPSAGIYAWNEELGRWFELGGSGIFRPEVTEPLGCTDPVLAWGFGVDRLAMGMLGTADIRDLYLADLGTLAEVPLCR